MKTYIVPQRPNYAPNNSKARILTLLASMIGILAFALTQQTQTASTLDGDGSARAASRVSGVGQTDSAEAQVTSGNPAIDGVVMVSSEHYGVDPRLVLAVMRKESRFNPRARSRRNAVGLMQIVPATAQRFHKSNVRNIIQNVDCGVHYLRWLLERFSGDVRLALAGYNAGENTVIHCGYRVPNIAETIDYVETIVAHYGQAHHPILDPDEAWQLFNPQRTEAAGL
jgi:soluble lytic murein transglycosylase-like protein